MQPSVAVDRRDGRCKVQLSPSTDRLIGIDTSGGDGRGDFSRGSILLFSGAAKYPALVENLQYYILPCFLHALLVQEGPLRLELPAGVVDVEAVRDDAGVVSITMEQLDGEFGTILDDRALVADVIGLQEDDLLPDVPVQCVTTGAWHIMCAVRDRALLDKCDFDQGKVRQLRAKYPDVEFFCLHVFHVGTADDGSVSTMARGFAELPDPLEDPFTGSATGCMGVFCRKYNLLGSATSFTAEQGVQMGRPGMASVAFSATTQRVRVTGPAVPVVKGTIFVDDA